MLELSKMHKWQLIQQQEIKNDESLMTQESLVGCATSAVELR
jgi:hypothetical protein